MIKYVVHPVTPEQKRAFGCKVVDARFAPKGAEVFNAEGKSLTAKPKPKKTTKKASE